MGRGVVRPRWIDRRGARSTIPAPAFGDTVPLGHYVTVTDRTVQHGAPVIRAVVSYAMPRPLWGGHPSRMTDSHPSNG